MPPGKAKYRFESEVHLGMLSIVMVLLLLSVASNLVLFNARVRLQDETSDRLRTAVVASTRIIHENDFVQLPDSVRKELISQHGLSGLTILPNPPAGSDQTSRVGWLRAVLAQLPRTQTPDIIDRLLRATPNKLMRGDGAEFFLVTQLPGAAKPRLAVVSMTQADLAYLQDGNQIVLWVGAGVTVLGIFGYVFLSRFIFRPFRKIREQAQLAGRQVAGLEHDADAVVEEYREVIRELREKEEELTRLNLAIQKRADSLEQFNQYLMSSIESGIISLDLKGVLKGANEAAVRLLGLQNSPAEQSFPELLGPQSLLGGAIRTAMLRMNGNGYREIEERSLDGRGLVLGVTISSVRDSEGKFIGWSVLLNDLTELMELRRQVEQSGRLAALGEMAAGLAHQIRNSLGAIGGFGNLVKRKLLKLDQPPDMADSLLKEAREAEELVSKFLAFARPLNPETTTCSLQELLEQIVGAYRARDDVRHINISVTGEDAAVNADPLLLKQVFGNLVDNAIQAYDGQPGRIDIRIDEKNGIASVRIVDYGSGIPDDKLDKIFTPFYSSRPSGTGLGLPLASRIIDLHGGTLEVDSQVGVGTTISVALPLVSPVSEPIN